MVEPNGTWDWLEQTTREARAVIDRLYREGHTGIAATAKAEPQPAETWPPDTQP